MHSMHAKYKVDTLNQGFGVRDVTRGPIDTGCIQPNCLWVSSFPGLGHSVAPCSSSEAKSDGEEHRLTHGTDLVEHIPEFVEL